MSLVTKTAELLYEKTKNNPLIIHMDAIGFFYYGENKGNSIEEIIENKLKLFAQALELAEEMGANILIPVFSYSITANKIFDVKNSPSQVGAATDFFRKKFYKKRTKDPLFSYIVFSKDEELLEDLKIKNFNTFGENSIIDKVYKKNGYIGSIGNVLWHPTEAHYIEQKLQVPYRFNKDFFGKIKDIDDKIYNIKTTFFCRKLEINLIADFKPTEKKMYEFNLVEKIKIDNFEIEMISFNKLEVLMKELYKKDKLFFCRKDKKEYKINI